MFEQLPALEAEHVQLERDLADPKVHSDQRAATRLGRRYAELGPIIAAGNTWKSATEDLQAAKEMAEDDAGMRAELPAYEKAVEDAIDALRTALTPPDPNDGKDVLLEVKAGEGGQESALFAGDLLRMYTRYAERHGWKTELLDSTPSDLGGIKDATLAVRSRPGGDSVWRGLQFEGGVHRVQRVPVTESQGRIHTSAAGVLVLPEAEDVEVEINDADLRFDVYRSSGPGGQSVNTTDSAVRITHIPTGIVVAMQNEKSQLQNREAGMRVLRARVLARAQEEQAALDSAARGAQIRTVDRSERIRTYNFAENRISDHRCGFKSYNLDQVLDGDLDAVVQALADADRVASTA